MIYKPKDFILGELVPKKFYEENYPKYKDNLWFIFDKKFLLTLQLLRNRYGKVFMNSWKWGGKDQYRGFRPWDCEIGAKLSQHKFGRAGDPYFQNVTADEVREDLFKKQKEDRIQGSVFEYITCIEDGSIAKTWFHFDVRNWKTEKDGILVVKP